MESNEKKRLMSVAQFSAHTGLSHTLINERINSGEIMTEKDETGNYKYRLIDANKYSATPKQRGPKPYKNDSNVETQKTISQMSPFEIRLETAKRFCETLKIKEGSKRYQSLMDELNKNK